MPNKQTNTNDGIVEFVLKAVSQGLLGINTVNMATITAINDDSINIIIDSTKEELEDVPYITLQGGGSFLQFPIAKDDKCLIIFSKDTVEDWLGGDTDFIYSSDFDINNGFALVGINNLNNPIKITEFVNFKVNQIKLYNDTVDLVTAISDITQQLIDVTTTLSTEITASAGSPFAGQASYVAAKTALETLKLNLDTLKVT